MSLFLIQISLRPTTRSLLIFQSSLCFFSPLRHKTRYRRTWIAMYNQAATTRFYSWSILFRRQFSFSEYKQHYQRDHEVVFKFCTIKTVSDWWIAFISTNQLALDTQRAFTLTVNQGKTLQIILREMDYEKLVSCMVYFRRTKLCKVKTEYANATAVKNIDRY